jgi:hypothetical protein
VVPLAVSGTPDVTRISGATQGSVSRPPAAGSMWHGCGFSAVSVWVAVPVVPVVRLIGFRFPGAGLSTTTMEHRGGLDDDDGALPWLRGARDRAGAGAAGAGAAAEACGVTGPAVRAWPGPAGRLTREKAAPMWHGCGSGGVRSGVGSGVVVLRWWLASRVSPGSRWFRSGAGAGPARCEGGPAIAGSLPHRAGGGAPGGARRRPLAGTAGTGGLDGAPGEPRPAGRAVGRAVNHDDGASWWSGRRRWSIAVVARRSGGSGAGPGSPCTGC